MARVSRGGGRVVGPVGTERDGERKREWSGKGGRSREKRWRAGDAVGAGGCRRTARVECERERAGIAGGRRRLRSNGDVSVHADAESVSALA